MTSINIFNRKYSGSNIDVSYDIISPGYYGDPTALRAFFYSATQSPLVVAMKGGFGEEKIDWYE